MSNHNSNSLIMLSLEDAFSSSDSNNNSNDTSNRTPADTILSLTNFLRYELSPQAMSMSSSGEGESIGESEQFTRLCRVFPKILELVFGVDRRVVLNLGGSVPRDAVSTVALVLDGGLLSRNLTPNWGQAGAVLFQGSGVAPSSNKIPRIGAVQHSSKQAVTSSLDRDVLVKLLSPSFRLKHHGGSSSSFRQQQQENNNDLITLFDAADILYDQQEGGAKFMFPLTGLPGPSKMLLLQLVASSSRTGIASSSWQVTMDTPQKVEPWYVTPSVGDLSADQIQPFRGNALTLYQSTLKTPLPEQTGLLHKAKYDSSYDTANAQASLFGTQLSASSIKDTSKVNNVEELYIHLEMLEAFIFSYMRFGVARASPNSIVMPHQRGLLPYGEKAYTSLFRNFLSCFFTLDSSSDNDLTKRSELFLRVLIDFWMDAKNEYLSSSEVGSKSSHTLANAYDSTQIAGSYNSPPNLVLKLLRELVCYLCYDSGLEKRVFASKSDSSMWCLSPALTSLQQSVFSFIKTALRFAPIHSGSCFHTGLSMWLLLVEPWNSKLYCFNAPFRFVEQSSNMLIFCLGTKHKYGAGQHARDLARQKLNNFGIHGIAANRDNLAFSAPDARFNEPSKYTKSWEPYIIANIHFYTTTLAIFLRRARELDFSRHSFNRSLQIVQRVFRVFTPEVIGVVSSVSKTPSDFFLFKTHERNLGAYCPRGSIELSGCIEDVKMLFEEIVIQHKKNIKSLNFLERVEDTLEGFFNSNAGSKGVRSNINRLVRITRNMLDLPSNIPLLPSTSTRTSYSSSCRDELNWRGPDRDPATGLLLTKHGNMQVLSGKRQCNPLDIPSTGDPMLSSVIGTYEIPFLVHLTIHLSNWLNKKCGFAKNDGIDEIVFDSDPAIVAERLVIKNVQHAEEISKLWFRFNLRLFADWRTLVLHIILLCVANFFLSIFL